MSLLFPIDNTPSASELKEDLTPFLAGKWQEVCKKLGIPDDRIKVYKRESGPEAAAFMGLEYWRNGNTNKPATWNTLLTALHESDLEQLATELTVKLTIL